MGVGHILCTTLRRSFRGDQDAKFKKGHVVTEEDIPQMLCSLAGQDIYTSGKRTSRNTMKMGRPEILCGLCRGGHMERSGVKEGEGQN